MEKYELSANDFKALDSALGLLIQRSNSPFELKLREELGPRIINDAADLQRRLENAHSGWLEIESGDQP